MKELYTKPQSMIEEFKTVDVVTTSGYGDGIEHVGGDTSIDD